MKRLLLLFLVAANSAVAENYKEKFEQLRSEKSPEKINALVDEWTRNEPDNPQAYILPANYYFATHGILISSNTGAPLKDGQYQVEDPKERFTITDPKTGKQVGSIGPDTRRDPGDVAKAKDLLRKATTRFPRRMDIWCGLAYMMQETGDFEGQLGVLQQMVAAAKKTPNELLWLDGQSVKEPADVFVPDKLHGYVTYYCRRETEQDDERFVKIARLSAENYPRHPYAFNDIALYYSIKKQLPETQRYLELALQADPNDTLVLMNLGDTCLKMKDKARAREYYQRVISLDSNPKRTEDARRILAGLDRQTKS